MVSGVPEPATWPAIGAAAWFTVWLWEKARRWRHREPDMPEGFSAARGDGRRPPDPGPKPQLSQEEIKRLRSMPYDEYLRTAWWDWRRAKYWFDLGAYRDETWWDAPAPFVVHHCGTEAYNHRGQERDCDLIGLSDNVHSAIHANLKKSGVYVPQQYRDETPKLLPKGRMPRQRSRKRLTRRFISW